MIEIAYSPTYVSFRCCAYKSADTQLILELDRRTKEICCSYIGLNAKCTYAFLNEIAMKDLPKAICIICKQPFFTEKEFETYENILVLGVPEAAFAYLNSIDRYKSYIKRKDD